MSITPAQRRDARLFAAAEKYVAAIEALEDAIKEGREVGLEGMRTNLPKSVYLYRTDKRGRIHKILEKEFNQ